MTNPIAIVINRPKAPTVRLRRKGAITKMDDGSWCATCRSEDGRTFWVSVTTQFIHDMQNAISEDRP